MMNELKKKSPCLLEKIGPGTSEVFIYPEGIHTMLVLLGPFFQIKY